MRDKMANLSYKKSHLGVLKILLKYLWPSQSASLKARIFGAGLALLFAKLVHIYAPISYSKLVDHLDPGPEFTEMRVAVALILAYAGARILSIIFQEIRELLFVKVSQGAMRNVALKVFSHLHHLPHSFHLNFPTGGVARVIDRGVKGIEFLLTFMLFNIIPTLLEMVIVSIILWNMLDIYYAIITLATVISYIIFTIGITEWRLKFRREMNNQDTKANATAVDSLVNFETVKYFNRENHEMHRYDESVNKYMQAAITSVKSLSLVNLGQAVIISTGLFCLLFMAVSDYQAGYITLGAFVLVNTYLLQLYLPLDFLGFVYREIRRSLTDMEEMFSLLMVKSDITTHDKCRELIIKSPTLRFEDVTFGYTASRPVLKNLSFSLKSGEKLAVVGTSGSGKTTISRLLFRFYDCTSGRITIDGQDIKTVSLQSLRRHIGIVPQDTVLFNDSLAYNIKYGSLNDISQEQLDAAAKTASIYDFIMSLENKYDTVVGERGLKLSGGEKQRVAIARAVLKDAPIIIFDEATSALDTGIEREVQECLNQLSNNRTTIIIAHRLSTVVHADKIIVLNNGQAVEEGNHKTLLAKNGIYAKMWQTQLKTEKD